MSTVAETCSLQAIAYIKQCLLDGKLSPGDPIKEVSIATELGISRGPVREALQTLLQEGLVTGLPQKAKHIRRLSAQEVVDSYCLGGTLEGACIVQSLPRLDQAVLLKARHVWEEMRRRSGEVRGLVELAPLDDAFHTTLMSRCRNQLMRDTARKACANISKFLYFKCWNELYSPDEFVRRHEDVLKAVESRDPRHIERTVLEHYRETGRRLAGICSKHSQQRCCDEEFIMD